MNRVIIFLKENVNGSFNITKSPPYCLQSVSYMNLVLPCVILCVEENVLEGSSYEAGRYCSIMCCHIVHCNFPSICPLMSNFLVEGSIRH